MTFTQSYRVVDAYDFVEIAIKVVSPALSNPFTEVSVRGEFTRDTDVPLGVDGFCDSDDGGLYRIRFMPSHPGDYSYSI